MRQVTVISPDGGITTQTVPRADYALLRSLVGGLIETVPHFTRYEGRPCRAFVDEEGQLKGLPLNVTATRLWRERLGRGAFRYEPLLYGVLVIDQTAPKAKKEEASHGA
jgi:hypothetical protein